MPAATTSTTSIVQASDGTLTDTQAIAVTVTNGNEAPVDHLERRRRDGRRQRRREQHRGDHGDGDRPGCRGDADLLDQRRRRRGPVQHQRQHRRAELRRAPNFEAPTDAGGNNVYDVIVQVSDGTLTDTQAIAVTVTNANEGACASPRTAAARRLPSTSPRTARR